MALKSFRQHKRNGQAATFVQFRSGGVTTLQLLERVGPTLLYNWPSIVVLSSWLQIFEELSRVGCEREFLRTLDQQASEDLDLVSNDQG
jgi:hypothetical protein